MKKTILVAEDEKSIRDALVLNLELEGYHVLSSVDGEDALNQFNSKVDLALLDVMMPKLNGYDVCRRIREKSQVPVIFLSAKGQAIDRIAGLKIGANDYIPKPFDLEELLLRIKVQFQLDEKEIEINSYQIGNKTVDFKTFDILEDGKKIHTISKRECALLKLMIEKNGEVVSRDEILDKVWGKDTFPTSRTIDNYILSFRKYFEIDPKNPEFFHSIRGIGYKFNRTL